MSDAWEWGALDVKAEIAKAVRKVEAVKATERKIAQAFDRLDREAEAMRRSEKRPNAERDRDQ